VLFIASLVPALQTPPAFAQSEAASKAELRALKGDLEQIRTELDEVKKELKLIRQFLQRRAAQPNKPRRVIANVSISGNPITGKNDAPVTLIEFSDYQCPFCSRFFRTTLPTLKTEYIETGKLRYAFRDFPLDQIHPQARKAAEAAHCAGEQGKYWEMHDLLFQNQKALEVEKLKAYAKTLNLDATAFNACLDSGKYRAEVEKDLKDGVNAGVRGTPAFFVGKTRPDDTIEGVMISGAHPFPVFQQEIERLLQEK
jgi:protein-disulfide isomerase